VVGGAVLALINNSPDVTLPLVGTIRSWQLVFLAVGIPSLAMLLPLATIREPRRRSTTGPGASSSAVPFADVLRFLWRERRAYAPMFIGNPCLNLFGYGGVAWFPTLFIRVHGMEASTIGLLFGSASAVMGVAGVLTAGWISDSLRSRGHLDAPLRAQVALLSLSLPFLLFGVLTPRPVLGMIGLGVFFGLFMTIATLGPTSVQVVTPGPIRAQVAAIWLMVANLVGIGFGPTSVALVTDYVLRDEMAVGRSIAIVGVITLVAGIVIVWRGMPAFTDRVAAAEREPDSI
jgi:hypothetical protein